VKIWQRGDRVGFVCPGCGGVHEVPVAAQHKQGAAWGWNGSLEKPSLHPSLKVGDGAHGFCCHFWVTNGSIIFLADCTHKLRNTTLELPEVPAS
jgi:Family of unknown function (DUF6527)